MTDKMVLKLADAAEEQSEDPQIRTRSYRFRAARFVTVMCAIAAMWWGSGYFFAYTDDAYVDSTVVSVAPQLSGQITKVAVADNQFVERGTLLFELDRTPFKLALQQAVAQQNEAEAQLGVDKAQQGAAQAAVSAAEAETELDASNLARETRLVTTGAVTRQSLETARSELKQSTGRMDAARSDLLQAGHTIELHERALQSAEVERRLAKWRLARTEIRAPVDGRITHLTLRTGDMGVANVPAAAIVDATDWHITANYKEYVLRHLRPGHTAWIWLDTHPWHLYKARIQGIAHGISRERSDSQLVPFVSPTIDWIRLDRRIPVRMTLVDPPKELFMGADARTVVFY